MLATIKPDGTILLAAQRVSGGATRSQGASTTQDLVTPHENTAEEGSVDDHSQAVEGGEAEGHAGVEAPNPILPEPNEIIWGGLSFLVLFVLMAKWGYPAIMKSMDARAERIRGDLDEATRARTEAETVLDEYRRQLSDARNESNRIIEEARQTADQLRKDLMTRAEAEVNELRQRSREDIDAAKGRAMSELRAEVSSLAIELAEKVVGRNLDAESNKALVDSFITEVGSNR
ncbi:MAG TPA: F0F1 ATP synthase subunit B [Acidimicrobiales bacterium]|nr:F0F1 ATP synthase subunit B [Acidimicrobiales bacterium]